MPWQNRVGPDGGIFRSTARGTFMGNRGILHDESGAIVRRSKGCRWLICLLEFKGIRRTVMSPGRYTELFFLDEAVGFAAGHRPCAECRRDRFNAFKAAWACRHGRDPNYPPLASEIDDELHRTRIDRRGVKLTYQAPLHLLPDGTFIQIAKCSYLVLENTLLLWTAEGYTKRISRPDRLTVAVLTPQPVVECFQRGYRPEIHVSSHAPEGIASDRAPGVT
jgi:hypothetical protein